MVIKTSPEKRQFARQQFDELRKLGLSEAEANHLATVAGISNLPLVRQIAANSRFTGKSASEIDALLASVGNLPYPSVVSELAKHNITVGQPNGDIRKAIKGSRQLLAILGRQRPQGTGL